jgi:hypothetical protein
MSVCHAQVSLSFLFSPTLGGDPLFCLMGIGEVRR